MPPDPTPPEPTPNTPTPPATDPAPPAAGGEPPKDAGAEPKTPLDPALDTKANPFKLEELKFSSPEITVDPAIGNELVTIVNDLGLPRDAVAKFAALHEKAMLANSEAGSRSWSELQDKWANEVRADPEIGGQNWPKVESQIGGLLDTFGSPELREAFDLTGAGNNPHVVRFMSKVASVLSEGGFISSNPTGGEVKSAAQILYPNQGKI